jgi:hypothetical protein
MTDEDQGTGFRVSDLRGEDVEIAQVAEVPEFLGHRALELVVSQADVRKLREIANLLRYGAAVSGSRVQGWGRKRGIWVQMNGMSARSTMAHPRFVKHGRSRGRVSMLSQKEEKNVEMPSRLTSEPEGRNP